MTATPAADAGPLGGAASRPIIDREAAQRLKIGLRRLRNVATLTGIGHRALVFSEADLALLERLTLSAARQKKYAAAALRTPTKRETVLRRHLAAALADRSGRQPLAGGHAATARGKRILKSPPAK